MNTVGDVEEMLTDIPPAHPAVLCMQREALAGPVGAALDALERAVIAAATDRSGAAGIAREALSALEGIPGRDAMQARTQLSTLYLTLSGKPRAGEDLAETYGRKPLDTTPTSSDPVQENVMTCKRCGKEKPAEAFQTHPKDPSRRIGICRECIGQSVRETRAKRRPAAPDGQKVCTICGETKPLDAYARQANGADGHSTQCKECRRQREQERVERAEAQPETGEQPAAAAAHPRQELLESLAVRLRETVVALPALSPTPARLLCRMAADGARVLVELGHAALVAEALAGALDDLARAPGEGSR